MEITSTKNIKKNLLRQKPIFNPMKGKINKKEKKIKGKCKK